MSSRNGIDIVMPNQPMNDESNLFLSQLDRPCPKCQSAMADFFLTHAEDEFCWPAGMPRPAPRGGGTNNRYDEMSFEPNLK